MLYDTSLLYESNNPHPTPTGWTDKGISINLLDKLTPTVSQRPMIIFYLVEKDGVAPGEFTIPFSLTSGWL